MLEETINRVRQGLLDSGTAHTIGFLAGIYLKVYDQAQIEQAAKAARENTSNIYQSIFDRRRNTQTDPKPPYASECEPAPLYPNLIEKDVESFDNQPFRTQTKFNTFIDLPYLQS